MHEDAPPIDEKLIAKLLGEQAPMWADLPIRRLPSTGTDNALFRLGDKLVVRIPRRRAAAAFVAKEFDWLPRLAGLPLDIPTLRFRGRAELPGLDCDFGILDWMEGDIASPENIADPSAAARSLAGFLNALHRKSVDGAPEAGDANNRRGVPLHEMSDVARSAIATVSDEIDMSYALEIWAAASAEPDAGPAMWLHGDLKADNLIAKNGRLSGIIDWGLSAVGDPAADYAAAWSWIDPAARDIFRTECQLDDGDWNRAKGWALYGAVIALSFYRGGKNDALCRQSRLTLSRLDLMR